MAVQFFADAAFSGAAECSIKYSFRFLEMHGTVAHRFIWAGVSGTLAATGVTRGSKGANGHKD
jgi:hypothetical protein